MVLRFRLTPVVALAILCACGTVAPPPAIDPALSERVPPSTVVLAGIDLDRLRASPLYAKLPPSLQAYREPFAQVHTVLMAFDGLQLLAIARGTIRSATIPSPGIALYGAPDLIEAATAKHAPAPILALADPVAAGHPIWIALRGGSPLPLEGNSANLNNLLRDTEAITLTIRPDDPAGIDITATSPTPDRAQHFEQSLRALTSMTAATTRDRDLAATLQALAITRADRVVHATLRVPLSAFSAETPPTNH